jgi:hypothetical protein
MDRSRCRKEYPPSFALDCSLGQSPSIGRSRRQQKGRSSHKGYCWVAWILRYPTPFPSFPLSFSSLLVPIFFFLFPNSNSYTNFLSPLSFLLFPTSYFLSPISYLLFPISYPISYFLSPISFLLFPLSFLLFPFSSFPLSCPYLPLYPTIYDSAKIQTGYQEPQWVTW